MVGMDGWRLAVPPAAAEFALPMRQNAGGHNVP